MTGLDTGVHLGSDSVLRANGEQSGPLFSHYDRLRAEGLGIREGEHLGEIESAGIGGEEDVWPNGPVEVGLCYLARRLQSPDFESNHRPQRLRAAQ